MSVIIQNTGLQAAASVFAKAVGTTITVAIVNDIMMIAAVETETTNTKPCLRRLCYGCT
jgi:hypothetical protein